MLLLHAVLLHYSHAEWTGNQFVSNSLPLQTGLPLFFLATI